MVTSDKSVWDKVISNYCPRCVIRFLAHDWNIIKATEDDIISHLEKLFNVELKWNLNYDECGNKLTCKACLDLLCSKFLQRCTEAVDESISSDSYEFSSFQCLYFLPVQLMISEHAACENFKTIFGKEFVERELCDVKETMKVLLEPMLTSKLGVERNKNSQFEISLHISHEEANDELTSKLKIKSPKSFATDKRKYNKYRNEKRPKMNDSVTIAQIKNVISVVNDSELIEMCSLLSRACGIERIQLHHLPVYVGGRYNKYSRELPQTPWFIDGKRKMENSVQEYLAKPIQEAFQAENYNFSSSGREDVDVRMLGNGRPYLIELINPRMCTLSPDHMKVVENKINKQGKDVASSHLQIVSKSDCKRLKEGEEEKTKSYSSTCCFVAPPTDMQVEKLSQLSQLTDVELKQKTPIRVLHRRPVAVRCRTVHCFKTERIDEDCRLFKLDISTQAGTYVKEFVHGDFGRTSPSLRDFVGAEVDIINLDVLSVDVMWPPLNM